MRKNLVRRTVALALGIGIFFTVFLWNFWTSGVNSVGINFMVFASLVILFYVLTQQKRLSRKSISWLLPTMVIIISLGIYSTPFTGIISLLLLPIIFFVFTSHESHKNLRQIIWSKLAPFTLGGLFITLLSSIFRAPEELNIKDPASISKRKIDSAMLTQIAMGVIILFAVSVIVVIPLLSSADAVFAGIFKNFITQIKEFLSNLKSLPLRLLVAVLVASILLGFAHYWNRLIKPLFKNIAPRKQQDNSIILGILLSGVLMLYFLFIGIQIHTLFTDQLPIDFSKTENLVKSGFWQLFALTILNILFYVGAFRKSTVLVQRILTVFTLASLLLIASAAQRMFLYVTVYGLSYEKFFAFYTVIFCSTVFIWFLFLFTYPQHKPVRIVKTLSFLALWMYAFTTIIPLEQFIFNTNLRLTQQQNSRININELRMLGFDALPLVETNFDVLIREARKDYLATKNLDHMSTLERENYTDDIKNKEANRDVNNSWQRWIERRRERRGILRTRHFNDCEKAAADNYTNCQCSNSSDDNYHGVKCKAIRYKKWYEHTIKELFYGPVDIDFKSLELPI